MISVTDLRPGDRVAFRRLGHELVGVVAHVRDHTHVTLHVNGSSFHVGQRDVIRVEERAIIDRTDEALGQAFEIVGAKPASGEE